MRAHEQLVTIDNYLSLFRKRHMSGLLTFLRKMQWIAYCKQWEQDHVFLHIAFGFSKILGERGRGSTSFVTVFETFNCSQVVKISPLKSCCYRIQTKFHHSGVRKVRYWNLEKLFTSDAKCRLSENSHMPVCYGDVHMLELVCCFWCQTSLSQWDE